MLLGPQLAKVWALRHPSASRVCFYARWKEVDDGDFGPVYCCVLRALGCCGFSRRVFALARGRMLFGKGKAACLRSGEMEEGHLSGTDRVCKCAHWKVAAVREAK